MLAERTVGIKPSGIRKFFDLVSEMDDPEVISLGVGEPDFDTPWHIREEGIYSLERGRTFYIEVINPVHYASYVEFGHRTPGGKGWVAGQYFLTLAESQLESRAPAIIEKELEKKLKEVFKI